MENQITKKKKEIQPDLQEIENFLEENKKWLQNSAESKNMFKFRVIIIFRARNRTASHLNEDGEKKREKHFAFRNPPTVKL